MNDKASFDRYGSIVYRKLCPYCGKPMIIPTWRSCDRPECNEDMNKDSKKKLKNKQIKKTYENN